MFVFRYFCGSVLEVSCCNLLMSKSFLAIFAGCRHEGAGKTVGEAR